MNPQDEQDKVLDAAYRRASVDAAGRPQDFSRRAILAAAAAEANRRAPAANEPRYWLRAVAGVAVLGVAVLLWRQIDTRMPGEAPVVLTAASPADTAAAPGAAPPAAPEAKASPEMRASAENSTEVMAPPRVAMEMPPAVSTAQVAAAAPPPPPLAEVASSEVVADQAPLNVARAERALSDDRADTLLRTHFPQLLDSDTPRSVWLLRDAAGNVSRSGELAAGQALSDIAAGPWQTETVLNARGQSITVATASP